jgi:hypothetical protein
MQLAQSPEACSSLVFPESMGALKVPLDDDDDDVLIVVVVTMN